MLNDECCEPTDLSKFNPRANYKSTKGKSKMFDFVDIKNPIEGQIVDTDDIVSFFKKYPLVPFAGDNEKSGHKLLNFLYQMKLLSPTHASCIENQKTYCFGGKIEVIKNVDPNFELDDAIITDNSLKTRFVNDLKKIKLSMPSFKHLAQALFEDYKTTGNAYFVLTTFDTLGEKYAKIDFYRQKNCLYLTTKPYEAKKIAISKKWSDSYLEKNAPMVIPLFPNYIDTKGGSRMTIFHIKDDIGDVYGRPDSMSSFMEQYREFQNSLYLSKQSEAGFVGQVLIEVEGDDPELSDDEDAEDAGFENKASRLEENFTNKGDEPMSILFLERPFKSKQAFVEQFKPNTNENFFDVIGKISRDMIISTHQWSRKLLGEASVQGLSNNQFIDELKTKLPLIDDYQSTIEMDINTAIKEAFSFLGITGYEDLSIKYKMPFKLLFNNEDNATEPTIGVGGDKIQPGY